MILISHILTICLPGNISRSGALGHQFLTSHLQHYPGSSRIILAHPELSWIIQGHPSSSRYTPAAHSGPVQLIQGHPGPSRIIRPIQNQTGPSNQTPTSPFGTPLTWVTPLRSASSIEVPVNWGTRPGLEPPQPGHSFNCWSYSVNSSGMAAISGLAQHLTPCAAPQALHSQSSLATTSGAAPQALRAEMANCSGSRSGCSRKRHIPSACCSISPGQGHQAE